ncbi:hypothetical protein GCM10009753_50510 [Streptantibioticus ferralitis]
MAMVDRLAGDRLPHLSRAEYADDVVCVHGGLPRLCAKTMLAPHFARAELGLQPAGSGFVDAEEFE